MAVPFPRNFAQAYAQQRAARQNQHRPRRTPLLVHAGRLAARLVPSWAGLRRFTLSVGGFSALSFAAWQLSEALGYAAVGLSLLILEALTGDTR